MDLKPYLVISSMLSKSRYWQVWQFRLPVPAQQMQPIEMNGTAIDEQSKAIRHESEGTGHSTEEVSSIIIFNL
jgi:hypothetical protein